MTGPQVTHAPDARRPVIVKHGDIAMHLTVIEAQALDVRLERVLAGIVGQAQPSDRLSAKQNRHLHALFRERGITDRHRTLTRLLGREIQSVNDLSREDATHCIDALRSAPVEPERTR
ncbi:MAG: hypothetical protein ACRD03_02860 [Acidimicrobiales bacterium]